MRSIAESPQHRSKSDCGNADPLRRRSTARSCSRKAFGGGPASSRMLRVIGLLLLVPRSTSCCGDGREPFLGSLVTVALVVLTALVGMLLVRAEAVRRFGRYNSGSPSANSRPTNSSTAASLSPLARSSSPPASDGLRWPPARGAVHPVPRPRCHAPLGRPALHRRQTAVRQRPGVRRRVPNDENGPAGPGATGPTAAPVRGPVPAPAPPSTPPKPRRRLRRSDDDARRDSQHANAPPKRKS